MSRYTDSVTGILVMLAGLGLLLISADVKDFAASSVGAAFMPRIAAVLFLLLGGLLTLAGWRALRAPAVEPQMAEPAPAESREPAIWGGWVSVACSTLLMLGYVALLEPLGFILTSAGYIFLQILVLRKAAPARYLSFALVATLVPSGAYLLFVQVFDVLVPAGILG